MEEAAEEMSIRQEMRELRSQLQSIHMVDEFAKYAKTERKLNKLKDQLNEICEYPHFLYMYTVKCEDAVRDNLF